jgi:predicted pyridoxine 5'-phosphate oxidase superfamily flavin-nucleotide-binding protein
MMFHGGERYVQHRLGQADRAEHVGQSISNSIPRVAAAFLADQPMIVVGAADGAGRMWASQITGRPGFVTATGEHTVEIDGRPVSGDPLAEVLDRPAKVGMIALQPGTRRRMRVNGSAEPTATGLRVTADQVYANCPKYIAKRKLGGSGPGAPGAPKRGTELDPAQRARVAKADTFFVASADTDGNVDASHRGGTPGFLRVLSPTELRWPDYAGNSMFMTLGNLWVNPSAGLLIPDWETGTSLQLSGTARLNWDPELAEGIPGAQCLIDFTVTDVVEIPGASPLRWGAPELSRVNPAPPDRRAGR